MTTAPQPLTYRGRQAAVSRVLVVDRVGDQLSVTWPVPPPWLPWAIAGGDFAAAMAQVLVFSGFAVLSWRLRHLFPGSAMSWRQIVGWHATDIGVLLASIAFCTTHGVLTIRRHRR